MRARSTAAASNCRRRGVNECVAKGLSVVQGDADTDLVDYPDDSFDYVILSQTLQATRRPRVVLEHMLRIGKRAIVSVPNFGHWRVRAQLAFTGRMPVTQSLAYSWYDTPNIHFCTIADFVALAREIGATIDKSVALDRHGNPLQVALPTWAWNLLGEQAVFPAASQALTRARIDSAAAPRSFWRVRNGDASMPINPAIQELVPDAQNWRRDLHANPELLYDLPRTANFVAERLREFGCDEVRTAIGKTGVVGVIRGRKGEGKRAIGLRADMDALPIEETTNLPYRSRVPGKMHACGHDGHTAMLLGAARYLARTRDFSGAAVVIFQPAEEGGAGAQAMIDDGLMEDFAIEEVYGMHNYAEPAGRRLRAAQRPADRRRRLLRDSPRRQRRPRRVPASLRGYDRRGRADRHRAANDRLAQRRSARFLRRLGRPLFRRLGEQRPAANRRTARARRARCSRRRGISPNGASGRSSRGSPPPRGSAPTSTMSGTIRRRSIIPRRPISPLPSRVTSPARTTC